MAQRPSVENTYTLPHFDGVKIHIDKDGSLVISQIGKEGEIFSAVTVPYCKVKDFAIEVLFAKRFWEKSNE